MPKQLPLPVPGVATLEVLWVRFPERCRNEVIALYARLTARAAQTAAPAQRKDPDHENPDR